MRATLSRDDGMIGAPRLRFGSSRLCARRKKISTRRFVWPNAAVGLTLNVVILLGVNLDEVDIDAGLAIALDAIHADRLALLCGAGLSMASPSSLPNAAQIAAAAKNKYDALYGATRSPLPTEIEEQAEFFFQRGELGTVYLRTLIDPHVFAGVPNAGHSAVADLLLVRGIQTAVSTNVDSLIETAGQMLFGQIGTGIDKKSVAALPPETSPLLKVHGCWSSDQDNTVWAPGQLTAEPVASRIAGSKEWLSIRLLDRDLVIVGYFTDWDYLNDVLERTLGDVRPARVVVVDPSDGGWLATKAPALYALGERAVSAFYHIRQSGDTFLDRLRIEFSRSFVRRMLHAGREAYKDLKGVAADSAWLEPTLTDAETLWRVRRDLEGRFPHEPARERVPALEPVLGLTLLQLRAGGAVEDGPYWLLDSQHIRVVRTPNQLLHQVQAVFERETPPVVAPDVVIAVGAESLPLPSHIVRAGTAPTIARGSAGRWLTRLEAVTEFGL